MPVMARAAEVPGAAGANLRKALDWLPKGRELLTVKRDVALETGLDALESHEADEAKLRELFARFGFRTWLRELSGGAGPAEAPGLANDRPTTLKISVSAGF